MQDVGTFLRIAVALRFSTTCTNELECCRVAEFVCCTYFWTPRMHQLAPPTRMVKCSYCCVLCWPKLFFDTLHAPASTSEWDAERRRGSDPGCLAWQGVTVKRADSAKDFHRHDPIYMCVTGLISMHVTTYALKWFGRGGGVSLRVQYLVLTMGLFCRSLLIFVGFVFQRNEQDSFRRFC